MKAFWVLRSFWVGFIKSGFRLAIASLTAVQIYKEINWVKMEDSITLATLNDMLNKKVTALWTRYSQHTTYFPGILVKQRKDFIIAEFEIDQRKCDIFSLLMEFFEWL